MERETMRGHSGVVHYVPSSFLERSRTVQCSSGVPFSVAVEPHTC